jgi:hypothetical protein
MHHPCQQCGYSRTEKDNLQTPEWQCPQCGVVTTKAEQQERRERPSVTMEPPPRQHQSIYPRSILFGTLILGLGLGYLGGREHLKYEMRQVLGAAATTMQQGLQHALKPQGTTSEAPSAIVSAPALPAPSVSIRTHTFPVELVKKGFHKADFSAGDGRDVVTLHVRLSNTLSQDLRAFEGMLFVTDLLDNPIITLHLADNDGVRAGSSSDWQGTVDFNQFIERHRKFRDADVQNIKLRFSLTKALYSDGTTAAF